MFWMKNNELLMNVTRKHLVYGWRNHLRFNSFNPTKWQPSSHPTQQMCRYDEFQGRNRQTDASLNLLERIRIKETWSINSKWTEVHVSPEVCAWCIGSSLIFSHANEGVSAKITRPIFPPPQRGHYLLMFCIPPPPTLMLSSSSPCC